LRTSSIDEFFGAADGAITVAMSAYLLFGVYDGKAAQDAEQRADAFMVAHMSENMPP
jgi:hypothetical protein